MKQEVSLHSACEQIYAFGTRKSGESSAVLNKAETFYEDLGAAQRKENIFRPLTN